VVLRGVGGGLIMDAYVYRISDFVLISSLKNLTLYKV